MPCEFDGLGHIEGTMAKGVEPVGCETGFRVAIIGVGHAGFGPAQLLDAHVE